MKRLTFAEIRDDPSGSFKTDVTAKLAIFCHQKKGSRGEPGPCHLDPNKISAFCDYFMKIPAQKNS